MDEARGYVLWVLKLKSDHDRAGKFQLHRKGRTANMPINQKPMSNQWCRIPANY